MQASSARLRFGCWPVNGSHSEADIILVDSTLGWKNARDKILTVSRLLTKFPPKNRGKPKLRRTILVML